MASNISQDTLPYYWCSANDDVIYRFALKPYLINGIGDDGFGKAYIQLFNVFDVIPIVGEYVYVNGTAYNGQHKIIAVSGSNIVTIDFPYGSTIATDTFYCYHLRVPVFNFYKGIFGGANSNLPYTFVVAIKPSITYPASDIPYIEINVKGITKYLFTIAPNTVANSIDYSMFSPIQFEWDDQRTMNSELFDDFTLVLNCALTNEELQYSYVGNGIYLGPTDKPLIATNGVSFATFITSIINGGFPTLLKFINGNQV